MITTPTAFVIGAGGSEPYGLPLGKELHRRAKAISPASELYQLLHSALSISVGDLNSFRDELAAHTAKSIDAFLQTQQHRPNTVYIGRAVIAALMREAMLMSRSHEAVTHQDWLDYLLDRIVAGCAGPSQMRCGATFLTFHFDSVIEERVSDAIRRTFARHPNSEIADALRLIDVIHIHGRLPPIPQGSLAAQPIRGFDSAWRDWLKAAVDTINIVHDSLEEATLAQAREVLSKSEIVCFLGFAYNPDNLSRLDVATTIKDDTIRQHVFGSSFGLTPSERNWVEGRFKKMQLAHQGAECRQVLEQLYVLRD